MESDSSRIKNLLLPILTELEAEDIFTPISMARLINIEDNYDHIIQIIKEEPHSCYPVYDDGIDNIVGILFISDLVINKQDHFNLQQLLHCPLFISENKNLADLLDEFKQKKTYFAVVVDEHGSVRGIVTKTDILEAFWSSNNVLEYDASIYIKEFDGAYLIDARLPLEDFNKNFHVEFNCEDCDSIGGFVIEQFAYVPQLGEDLVLDTMSITVTKTEGAKLQELMIKMLND